MPIHVYQCDEEPCAHNWEELMIKSTDVAPEKCPKCGSSNIHRAPTAATHKFRAGVGGAGGWEMNDQGTMQRTVKGGNTTKYGEGHV